MDLNNGGMYAQGPIVTFLEAWGEPDLHPVLHLPKQQRPAAWITALRYQRLT